MDVVCHVIKELGLALVDREVGHANQAVQATHALCASQKAYPLMLQT